MNTIIRLSLAIVAIGAMLLASCAPQPTAPPEPTTPPEATEAPEPTEAPPEEAEAPPPEEEGITVVYWSMWNQEELQGQVLQQAVDAFEAANPSVTVDVVWNGRENRNLVIPAIEGGEAIDVFDTGDEWIFANAAGYALSLEDVLDDPAIDGDGTTVRETIMQALLYNFPVDGEAVMMPYQPYAVLWFYNKDLFADAGVTAEPTTWAELRDACQAVVDAGYECITTDVDAYLDILWGYYAERAFGGCQAVTDAMNDATGESWRDPMWLQMAEDYYVLSQNGYLLEGTAGNLYPAGQQALALGEVTMYLNGTWLPTEVLDTAGPDFNWGSFSFPDVEGGAGASTHVMMGSQAMVIVNTSEHPQQAWEFIKYVVSPDIQQAFVDVALVPAVHTDVPWTGNIAEAYEAVRNADLAITWGCDIWTSEVSGIVLDAFGKLFIGDSTPEEYIDQLATETADFWAGQ
jgi:raffinose/stachyose/melibiose transport system substrate-binding protein